MLLCVLLCTINASIDLEAYKGIILLINFGVIKTWNINILVLLIKAEIFVSLSHYHIVVKTYLILIVWQVIKCAFMNIKILNITRWYFPASIRLKSNVFLDKWDIHIFLWFFHAIIYIIIIKYWNNHFIEISRFEIILWQEISWVI